MYIQVKSVDGQKSFRVDHLSLQTKVEDLKKELVELFDLAVERQRLFYGGKQLEDGYTLLDYSVRPKSVVEIAAKPLVERNIFASSSKYIPGIAKLSPNKENEGVECENSKRIAVSESKYFKIGEIVDFKDPGTGAWFEAEIAEIHVSAETFNTTPSGNGCNSAQQHETSLDEISAEYYIFIFRNTIEGYVEGNDEWNTYAALEPAIVPLHQLRPRKKRIITFEDINIGEKVMANYNFHAPTERGFWYDCTITEKKASGSFKKLVATIYVGSENTVWKNCCLQFIDEVFAIEELCERNSEILSVSPLRKESVPKCNFCENKSEEKCTQCGCHICGGKDEPDKQIVCEKCKLSFHIWCLKPPLSGIPKYEDWYCCACKINNLAKKLKQGKKHKKSKKRAKMPSRCATMQRRRPRGCMRQPKKCSMCKVQEIKMIKPAKTPKKCKKKAKMPSNSATKQWGRGMACVGRTKEGKTVPIHHFGPVPGIEVGMMWKTRFQVSKSGVHRPPVGGIHGSAKHGAYSVVLSGGYEDNKDDGDEFIYTGSGGRYLAGNKRTAGQSCDQKLTSNNRALALNCAAKFNNIIGAVASDWKKGKPVRVVRNYKGKKHSKYCPDDGNRYDGIYKVVKYWPEKGKSGFVVWRYLLRRDDPTPAPWAKADKERIESMSFKMEYPEGYEENAPNVCVGEPTSSKKSGGKRSCIESDASSKELSPKRCKICSLPLPLDIDELIREMENRR